LNANFDPSRLEPSSEYFVEVTGTDGLKHHVGPFKVRQDAEDWIAQNTPDLGAAMTMDQKPMCCRSLCAD
jgi:hypothetical protein